MKIEQMIWNEMIYNKFQDDSANFEVEPEELFEYFQSNTKVKEERFDEFDQIGAFVLS